MKAAIVSGIRREGIVRYSELEKDHQNLTVTKVNAAVEALCEISFPLRFDPEQKVIIEETDNYSRGLDVERKSMNYSPKMLVADAALSFVVGFPHDWKGNPGQKAKNESRVGCRPVESIYTVKDIENSISGVCSIRERGMERQLLMKWSQMRNESSRMMALDAGTTNEILAEKLASLTPPLIGSNLNHLMVCTNSRNIFQTLGHKDVPIRTVIIGGQQRGRTASISGALAELFVRTAALLQFGCAIIGATKIATESGYCYAESQEDAVMKGLLLGRSNLRVVIADNTKVQEKLSGVGFAACALSPNFVDLVITNAPLDPAYEDFRQGHELEMQRQRVADFPKRIKQILDHGVPVLIATSPKNRITTSYEFLTVHPTEV